MAVFIGLVQRAADWNSERVSIPLDTLCYSLGRDSMYVRGVRCLLDEYPR
jgi:hypothetical protein